MFRNQDCDPISDTIEGDFSFEDGVDREIYIDLLKNRISKMIIDCDNFAADYKGNFEFC